MDRIYTNHRHGERRIHLEIGENEIADLLDDIEPNPESFDSTKQLVQILKAANEAFENDRMRDTAEAETSRT